MSESRLNLALKMGEVALPDEGRILYLRPRSESDLEALPKDRCLVEAVHFPDFTVFRNAGWDCTVAAAGKFCAAIVFVPRSKELARALIARAMELTDGGPVVVDGQKTDGIDSLLRDCKKAGAGIGAVFSKSHGKLFECHSAPDQIAAWNEAAEVLLEGGYKTGFGIFSADGPDRGSVVLADSLPKKLAGRVADLGAGWGYLSIEVLKHAEVSECHLIEADFVALEFAKKNIQDDRAEFHWADATKPEMLAGFDHVVCNPPFHSGRTVDIALGRAFIASAARILKPTGKLWLVANRHLPYEETLSQNFRRFEEIAGDRLFKVFRAEQPNQQGRYNPSKDKGR